MLARAILCPGGGETGRSVSLTGRRSNRRRFLTGFAGFTGAVVLDPAAIGRAAAARTPRLPDSRASETRDPSYTLVGAAAKPSLNHLAWVWQFTHDGGKEEIRRVLAQHDLGVVLKTHDGVDWMSTYDASPDAVSGPTQVAALAAFFEDGGVPFHAWCVLNGVEPKREAQMAAEVLAAGARSISLDLESHAGFWVGDSRAALQLGRELRGPQPDAWVVTSIDARPWEIDRIPLAEFSTFSSEIAPQVYWAAFETAANVRKFTIAGYPPPEDGGITPRFLLDVADEKLQTFGLPVHPIGDGTRAEESEWRDFIERAYAMDAEAVSVWRYGVTASSVWRLLEATPPRPLTYSIQPGDSLSALAERWGSSVQAIADINGIADPNLIQIGATLRLPRGANAPRATPLALYTVQPGDTLGAIAERFDASAAAIADLNGIANPDLLSVGQELSIPRGAAAPPQSVLYTVRAGDSLTAIARAFGATVDELVRLNGIVNPNLLSVGTQLRVR